MEKISNPSQRQTDLWVMLGLFILAFGFYFFRLSEPPEKIYDEVYHPVAAVEYLQGKNPSEWTHPPLAKLFIAASIATLGDHAIAWRLPSAITGAGVIAMMYWIMLILFKRRRPALIASGLLLFDGLQFTLSRISMLDVPVTFFILLAYGIFCEHFYMEWKADRKSYFLLGLFLGLAVACKWIGVYAYGFLNVSLIFLFFIERYYHRRLDPSVYYLPTLSNIFIFLILLPLGIYLLSYVPYMQQGHSIKEVIRLQSSMLNYHATVHKEHDHIYASPWWTWIFLLRPVWLYYQNHEGIVRGSVFLGNPAVFWVGVPALLAVQWMTVMRKSRALFFILLGFCFQYLPWAVSPRKLTFFQHFYSSLPFMVMAIAACLDELWKYKCSKWLVWIYLCLVAGLFVYFYPILSALPVPEEVARARMWFINWI